jgi:hypothetical protein
MFMEWRVNEVNGVVSSEVEKGTISDELEMPKDTCSTENNIYKRRIYWSQDEEPVVGLHFLVKFECAGNINVGFRNLRGNFRFKYV